jgi:hypothetical protein
MWKSKQHRNHLALKLNNPGAPHASTELRKEWECHGSNRLITRGLCDWKQHGCRWKRHRYTPYAPTRNRERVGSLIDDDDPLVLCCNGRQSAPKKSSIFPIWIGACNTRSARHELAVTGRTSWACSRARRLSRWQLFVVSLLNRAYEYVSYRVSERE